MKRREYLKFAGRIFRKKNALPLYLVFFITERCLARCRHCLLGNRIPPRDELSLEEIEKISGSMDDLLFLLLTGGDPFIRKDVPEIAKIFYKNNRVRNLGMPTNGSLIDNVVRSSEKILMDCPDLDFAVDISIDGIGKDHDDIRRLPGLFDKAIQTYRELEKLQKHHPNFNLNVAVTVSSYNEDKLEPLYEFLRDDLGVKTINQLLVRGEPREEEAGLVHLDKYLEFSRMITRDTFEKSISGYHDFPFSDMINAMKNIRQEIIADTLNRQAQQVPCYAGNLSGVIYPTGEVYPCELLNDKMGSLREQDYDLRKIWFSDKAESIRKKIKNSKCWCTYECFLTNSILFTPRMLPRVFSEFFRLKWKRNLARRRNGERDKRDVSR